MKELGRRSESLTEVMRKSINVHNAANVLNRCIDGDQSVTPMQERVATVVYNKMVPSYAAIMLDVVHSGPSTVHDLNAMLLSSGLQPLDTTAEIPIEGESVLDGGAPVVEDT